MIIASAVQRDPIKVCLKYVFATKASLVASFSPPPHSLLLLSWKELAGFAVAHSQEALEPVWQEASLPRWDSSPMKMYVNLQGPH